MDREIEKLAEAAKAVVAHYKTITQTEYNTLQEAVVDLIADLLHLLRKGGVDTNEVIALAESHHLAEIEDARALDD